MGVKAGNTCLQWSQPIVHHSSSCSQTLASSFLPSSSRRWNCSNGGALAYRFVHTRDRSALFRIGTQSTKLRRSQSCEVPKSKDRKHQTLKRACSASLDAFSDEQFSKNIQELATRFRLTDDEDDVDLESEGVADSRDSCAFENLDSYYISKEESSQIDSKFDFVKNRSNMPPSCLCSVERPRMEEPQMARDHSIPAGIEWKANSVDLPASLRIIKKFKWQEGAIEAGESVYCSVKKAFSSMVFIIQELHSYTLQMREILFHEDLQGIIFRVQKEMHASFVWLFQHIFSQTPILMMYVMILLANFTVQSMASNNGLAASAPVISLAQSMESVSLIEFEDGRQQKFDSSAIKTFPISSSSQKTTSVGGNNGGAGKFRQITSGTDGDGHFDGLDLYRIILPDGASQLSSLGTTREAESVPGQVTREEELSLWNSIVDEALRMQASLRDGILDQETMQTFVSPVNAKIEADEHSDYFRTELLYQMSLSQEPNNPLLLANYAQFLYLVAHEYDRAEEYFKKATEIEAPDAETLNKYASFLWLARKDHWAAEETYLEAIAADPTNYHYAANYANFLWNTGGDDTCFPLNSP